MFFDYEEDEFDEPSDFMKKNDRLVNDEQNTSLPEFSAGESYESKIRKKGRTIRRLSTAVELQSVLAAKSNNNAARLRVYWHMTKTIVFLIDFYGGEKAKTEFAELYHESLVGLEAAIQKYDPNRGVRFATFARSRIINAICLAANTRYPHHVSKQIKKIEKASANLSKTLNREPEISEIARNTGLSEKVVTRHLELAFESKFQSLDEMVEERGELDIPSLDSLSHLANTDLAELMEVVMQALTRLEPREQMIISLRFGLRGEEETSLLAISHKVELCERRLRAVYQEGFRKLVRNVSIALEEPQIYQQYLAHWKTPQAPSMALLVQAPSSHSDLLLTNDGGLPLF